MKPIPTHNTFNLCLHSVVILANTLAFFPNLIIHRHLLATFNFIGVFCFTFIGMDNFKKFLNYRKEMKTYKIEQEALELQNLQAQLDIFSNELKAKELKEKFSSF